MKHLNYCYKPLLGNLWETTLRNYHDISNFQLLVSYLFMYYHSFHKITIPNIWCFYVYIEPFYKILQELHESYTIAMSMIKKWFNKMDGYRNQVINMHITSFKKAKTSFPDPSSSYVSSYPRICNTTTMRNFHQSIVSHKNFIISIIIIIITKLPPSPTYIYIHIHISYTIYWRNVSRNSY